MNIFAILNHMGVFFKEEPVRQLHAALEKLITTWFIRWMTKI